MLASFKSKMWNVFCPAIFLHFRMVCEGKGGSVDVPLTAGRATGTYRDLGTGPPPIFVICNKSIPTKRSRLCPPVRLIPTKIINVPEALLCFEVYRKVAVVVFLNWKLQSQIFFSEGLIGSCYLFIQSCVKTNSSEHLDKSLAHCSIARKAVLLGPNSLAPFS